MTKTIHGKHNGNVAVSYKKLALVILLLLPCFAAGAEEPAPGSAQVPREVLDGTAKLLGHYEGESLRLALALSPPHKEEEEKFLEELQNRSSPQFHKFLTPEEWNTRFAPSAEDEQKVADWATASGFSVTKRYPNRLIIDVEAPVEAVEHAFHVTINRYQLGDEVDFSNDRDPVLPPSLTGILQAVLGLNNIQRLRPASHSH